MTPTSQPAAPDLRVFKGLEQILSMERWMLQGASMSHRPTLLAFVSGAAVMAAEMAATRLVAPHFGASTPVWATLISFVLLGLAWGASLGGRAGDRAESPSGLIGILAATSLWLALLPFAARILLGDAAHSLHDGAWVRVVLGAGLFAAMALPPVVALGAVGPFLVATGRNRGEGTGELAGRLSAASTLGSIVGTLGAAFFALPLLGTARTFAVAGMALALAAASPLRWSARLAISAGPALALLLAHWALPLRSDAIDARESGLSFVQTIEAPDGTRRLVFDEAHATQSIWKPGSPVRGEVFGHYALAPAFIRTPEAPRVLLLGLGAGTGLRAILEAWPTAQFVGVELDAEVVRQARAHFDLPESLEVHIADARAFLRSESRRFDVIVTDAFRFPYVPFHLTTIEFDTLLRDHLSPGGAVMLNVGRYGHARGVVDAVAGTLRHRFDEVVQAEAHNLSNTLVIAGDAGLRERLALHTPLLPPDLRPFAERVRVELRSVAPGEPLTDDHAPVEWMTDSTVVAAFARQGGRL